MQDTAVLTGMVLSQMPVGEADRRVVLITRELGRLSCFARGARRPKSMLGPATRTFAFGHFTLRAGKDAYVLVQAEITDYFEAIVTDVASSAYACYFAELVTYFTREGQPEEETLLTLYYALKALEAKKMKKDLIRRAFEVKMLAISGLLPEFTEEKDPELLKSTRYALNFSGASAPNALFCFDLTEEVKAEFDREADRLLQRNVDRPLASLSLISVLDI